MLRELPEVVRETQGTATVTKTVTPDSIIKAIDEFERTVTIDPNFGQAWLALRTVYNGSTMLLTPEQTVNSMARAADAMEHARTICR